MNSQLLLRTLAAALFLVGCETPSTSDGSVAPCTPGTATLDELFVRQFGPRCLACHGTGSGEAGLVFTNARSFYLATVNVPSTTDRSLKRINPGHPETSHLVYRISASASLPQRMPLNGPSLDTAAIDAIAGWICAGAPAPATDAGPDAGTPDAGTPDAGLALTTFAPQAGVVGTHVTLTGTGFSTTASEDQVSFAGTPAPVLTATENTLQVDVPPDAGTGPIEVSVLGVRVTSATRFTVVPGTPAPTLTSVTPSRVALGAGAQTLVLDGLNFTATSTASLDGTPISTTFASATRLTAQVGAAVFSQAGTHAITVTTTAPDGGSGGGTSAALTLTVENPAPVISLLTPSVVASGGGAFVLTVTGTGFVSTSVVELDGAPVTTTFSSGTALSAPMPSFSTPGPHDLRVRNPSPGGGPSAPATLTVQALPQPSISTLSPNPGPAGQPFTLTLTGANFTCAGAGPVVLFDGGSFTPSSCAATSLSTSIPATPVGTGDVRVRNPNTDLSAPVALTLVTPNLVPTLTALVPSQVNSGSGAQTLRVEGTDFVAASSVRVDGVARTTVFVDAGVLTASLLATDVSSPGTRSITVSSPAPGGGTSSSLPLPVVFVNPVPALASLTPSLLVTGSGPSSVTIDGSGFVGTSQASFDGSNRTTTFISASQVIVSLTAPDVATPGIFPIGVTNPAPGGGASNRLSLSIGNPVPTVSSLSPCGVVAGPGFTLTLDGTGFLAGTTVTVEGTPVTTTFVNATRLTLALPGSLVGTAPPSRALAVLATNSAPGGGPSSPAYLGLASQTRSLATDVQPIFTAACAASCHAGTFPSGGLNLSAGVAATKLVGVGSANCAGLTRVVACGPLPSQSLLVDKLAAKQLGAFPTSGCGGPMPQTGSITPTEFQSIVDWVAQGAPP